MLLLIASPCAAQTAGSWSAILSADWIWKTGTNRPDLFPDGQQNFVILDVGLQSGGGGGGALNYRFADRWSAEVRTSVLWLHAHSIVRRGDAIGNVDLGKVRVYPLTAVLQYHFAPIGSVTPYIGAGGSCIIVARISHIISAAETDSGLSAALHPCFGSST